MLPLDETAIHDEKPVTNVAIVATMNFTVLYTHQKTKKCKTWQDGKLMISSEGSRATLYDDKAR